MAYGQDDLWLHATGRGRTVTPQVQQQWGLQPVQARPIDKWQRGRNLRQLIDWRRQQGQRQQPQLASMLQQPQPQLGTFGTPAPQQPQRAAFRTPAPQPQEQPYSYGQPQFGGPQQPPQQPKPKYDWQQPQLGGTQPQQPQTGGLLPGQPLPPTAQFGYRQPYGYRGRQGLGQPYESQFGGLSQYFNY